MFQDPFAEGDVRCLYDKQTQSFYFTEIGFPVATGPAADDNNTTADVVVMNKHGVAAYQFDTSLGGPAAGDCFGTSPRPHTTRLSSPPTSTAGPLSPTTKALSPWSSPSHNWPRRPRQ